MSNPTHPYGYWTDDRIIEESKKYKTKIEFKVNAPTAYKKANEKKHLLPDSTIKPDEPTTIQTTAFCPHCGARVRVGVVLLPE